MPQQTSHTVEGLNTATKYKIEITPFFDIINGTSGYDEMYTGVLLFIGFVSIVLVFPLLFYFKVMKKHCGFLFVNEKLINL